MRPRKSRCILRCDENEKNKIHVSVARTFEKWGDGGEGSAKKTIVFLNENFSTIINRCLYMYPYASRTVI